MSASELWTSIDEIRPDPFDPESEGWFDSIDKSLKTIARSVPKPAAWNPLPKKVAALQLEFNTWIAEVESHQDLLASEKWKGKGPLNYEYLTQTFTNLCQAVEALKDWADALADVSASLKSLKPDDKLDTWDRKDKRITITLDGSPVQAVKMIFTVACRLVECQRFDDLIKGPASEQRKSTEDAIVEEIHSDFYQDVLRERLGLKDKDTEAVETYLRTFLPQSISQAVQAAKKDKSAPKVPQPDPAESQRTTTNRAQLPGATSDLLGGQAAV